MVLVSITCDGCGNKYGIGCDALVISANSLLADFAFATLIDVPSAPDLVCFVNYSALDDCTKLEQAEETNKIVELLLRGQDRKWRCQECSTVNLWCIE